MNFDTTLERHHMRAVPLVLVDGAIDELSTVRLILRHMEKSYELAYIWRSSAGLEAAGCSKNYALATRELTALTTDPDIGPYTTNPEVALRAVVKILDSAEVVSKEQSVGVVLYMGDRILAHDNPERHTITQLLMDLRDPLKNSRSCIYLVGITFDVPVDLKEHVVILNAPMPSNGDYQKLIDDCYKKLKEWKPTTKFKLTDELSAQYTSTLRGMSEFAAEQTLFLSTDENGIDAEMLRERAIQTINSTRGLSVYKGDGRGFAAIGGLDGIKDYTKSLINGRLDIRAIVYADEVEKTLAGAMGGDTSGVSGNFLGKWLSEIQDTKALGMLLTGIPGCAKSEFAKRLGEEAGALTIHFDLAGMKDSLVGNSEANLNRALMTIREIGGTDGGILYVATSNRIAHLPPEFRRRFNLGTFFFEFPTDDEQTEIAEMYIDLFGLTHEQDDRETFAFGKWTGAEIESCCRLAYLRNCKLSEAAQFIVPVAETAKEEVEKLMDQANGRFLSASSGKVYTKALRSAGRGRSRGFSE